MTVKTLGVKLQSLDEMEVYMDWICIPDQISCQIIILSAGGGALWEVI